MDFRRQPVRPLVRPSARVASRNTEAAYALARPPARFASTNSEAACLAARSPARPCSQQNYPGSVFIRPPASPAEIARHPVRRPARVASRTREASPLSRNTEAACPPARSGSLSARPPESPAELARPPARPPVGPSRQQKYGRIPSARPPASPERRSRGKKYKGIALTRYARNFWRRSLFLRGVVPQIALSLLALELGKAGALNWVGKTLDLSKACKQLPLLPVHRDLAVTLFWDRHGNARYYIPKALMSDPVQQCMPLTGLVVPYGFCSMRV